MKKRESDTDIKRSEQKRKFTHDSEGKKINIKNTRNNIYVVNLSFFLIHRLKVVREYFTCIFVC